MTVAKRYDVIVVGAGPAGLLAAKAAGENGLEVALLERKTDITQLTRACGQTLVSMNEYLFGDLCVYNARDKRICFPVNGFSFKYGGPYKNIYSCHFYTPTGYIIELGDLKEQRGKLDHGAVGVAFDKEILLRCLLEEVKACSVDVFPGINAERVTRTAEGVIVEGSGRDFEGTYLIAADGVNSRIARSMGFNKDRYYYCNFYSLSYRMSGIELPEPDIIIYTHVFLKGGGAMFFLIPRPTDGEYSIMGATVDPGVNLEVACDYFMKKEFCAPWFKKAKKLNVSSAVCNCYSPIIEPFKDHVVVAGDAGSTQELENTGAMMSGWKAGQAISTAVRERNLGLEIKGLSEYVNWWKDSYINSYNHETYMKTWALTHILTTEEEISYVFGLIKETLRPCWNPYTSPLAQGLKKVMPTIQQERPEVLQKLGTMSLPLSQIFAEVTKVSKPVS
jgi:digeranylgeranylglycerophospholipid reductase